jgi:phage replication O-like protein O
MADSLQNGQEPPQLENGHIRIANALFDAILAFPFSKREQSVVLAVLRKTYGYRKKTDRISASQIAGMTGISRGHVTSTISQLVARGVFTKTPNPTANILGINKRHWEWSGTETVQGGTETGHVPKRTKGGTETVTLVVPKQDTQQTKIQTKIKTRAQAPELPPEISPEKWAEWVQHRIEIRKKLTPSTIAKQIKVLTQSIADGIDAEAVIDESITNGWTGLFPAKQKGSTNGTHQPKLSAADRVEAAYRRKFADGAADGEFVDAPGRYLRR